MRPDGSVPRRDGANSTLGARGPKARIGRERAFVASHSTPPIDVKHPLRVVAFNASIGRRPDAGRMAETDGIARVQESPGVSSGS